jgi:hypothetical protein
MHTLEEAKTEIQKNLRDGYECPCCGQLCKLYRRKLNANMARFLIDLAHATCKEKQWVPYSECRFRGRDYNYLAMFGLAVTNKDSSSIARTSGLWKITKRGLDFVRGYINIPSHVFVYNNTVHGFSEKMISIQEALGEPFNYEELMNS